MVNATQAIDGEGTITVRLHETSDEIVLSVQDTGVGIPPEMLATIFEPFVSTKESGRGLGLSIVKTAIVRCGCSIDVQSTLNEGTEIRIHIPIDLKKRHNARHRIDDIIIVFLRATRRRWTYSMYPMAFKSSSKAASGSLP